MQSIFHFPGNPSDTEKVLFKIKAADHDNITKVQVVWSLNGVEQAPIPMTDHKKYNDNKDVWDGLESGLYGTRVYGVEYGPFVPGSIIEYQISATDILGNTVVHPLERTTIKVPKVNPFVREIDLSGIVISDPNSEYNDFYWGASHTASDSQGNLFVVATVHDRLGNTHKGSRVLNKYGPDGLLVKAFKLDDPGAALYASIAAAGYDCPAGPSDVAIDGQDNIYIICQSEIHKLTSEGDYIESYSSPCDSSRGLLEIDKNSGTIYVTVNPRTPGSSSSGSGIVKLDSNGNCDFSTRKQFRSLNGHTAQSIAVDSVGNVYISDDSGYDGRSGNNIHKYAPDGTKLAEWGPAGDKDEEFSGERGSFIRLAVGKDGFVYATDSKTAEIKKFTSEGDFVSKWEGKSFAVPVNKLIPPPADGYFSGLGSISVDSVTGNIYVTDSCNDHECRTAKKRVQVFSPF